jgi:hypothetical protein
MESHIGKKRKLEPDSEAGNEANPLFLIAQHKGLSINLYRYRRRITDLEAQLKQVQSRYLGVDDAVSGLRRRLQQVRGRRQIFPNARQFPRTDAFFRHRFAPADAR